MSKKYRVPQVPSEPMPELAGFLAPFRVRFRRVESQAAMERYITGLLTDHLNKNCDTLYLWVFRPTNVTLAVTTQA